METKSKRCLADVFVSITDPRQAKKVEHDLVELRLVAVNTVLVGADTFDEAINSGLPEAGFLHHDAGLSAFPFFSLSMRLISLYSSNECMAEGVAGAAASRKA